MPQALAAAVREGAQPVAGEFSRALAEARLGIDLQVVRWSAVANRMNSDDLRWVVMAIRIQREVGGNLAESDQHGGHDARACVPRIVTCGAQRGGAAVRLHPDRAAGRDRAVSVLPRPGYVRPLYTTAAGLLMLGGSAVLFVVGVLWMRVVIKVEA